MNPVIIQVPYHWKKDYMKTNGMRHTVSTFGKHVASAFGIQTYKLIYDSECTDYENLTREETKQKLIKMIAEM